jgi:hypothetical protein
VTFTFRPAVRESVGLLIGLAGSSGSGKTYSALRLAKGIAGGRPFAFIDTEAGRAKHYAGGDFHFDHGDLKPPFRPEAYEQAIAAADAAGYPVIVVDSMSHVWSGDGGVLDWQAEEFERMGSRDAVKIASWIKPKMAHKHMVARLLQLRAHLILCFRAEEKIEIVKEDGKTKIVPKEGPGGFKGWLPICEKNLPYELTASFLLTADAPGVPLPMKLQEQHRALFPLGVPITEEAGAKIAAWAGGAPSPAADDPRAKVEAAAKRGTDALAAAWREIGPDARKSLGPKTLEALKIEAAKHDAPGAAPVVTVEQVIARMHDAIDADALDAEATLIDELPDAQHREKARAVYHERRESLGA